jgi:hypothetical protein
MPQVADPSIFVNDRRDEIDIVYTWVDGSSDEFKSNARYYADLYRRRFVSDELAFLPSRFDDNDCLRYSMRSVAAFAPWARNIFIVTNGQKPEWLDTSHPRIRLVTHRDIFPDPSVLPTFNSCGIETNLHRIPSLSRCFLYFNDDFLLGRASKLDEFFSRRGKIRARFQDGVANNNINHEVRQQRAIAYCHRQLDQWFGAKPHRHHYPHCPVMFNKAVLESMERDWRLDFDRTRSHRFRNERDCFVALLYIHYLAEHYEILFRDEDDQDEVEYLKGQGCAYIALGLPGFDLDGAFRAIRAEHPRYICINDVFGAEGPLDPSSERETRTKLSDFLAQYYPDKAEWEH